MQRWFSRSPLEGTKQDLSLCPCKKHTEEQSHGTCVRFQWQPLQSCSDKHRWGKTPCKTVLFRGYSLLPPVKATPTVQLVFCPQWQHLSCLLPLEQLYYLLPNSKPSHVITNKDLSVKSAPDGHSCWSCWRLLYPLALLVHSNSVFCYLDGKDISALPLQEQNGGQQSPHLLLLVSWLIFLHFRLVFCTESVLSLLYFYSTPSPRL